MKVNIITKKTAAGLLTAGLLAGMIIAEPLGMTTGVACAATPTAGAQASGETETKAATQPVDKEAGYQAHSFRVPVPPLPYKDGDSEAITKIKDEYNQAHYTTVLAGACIGVYDPENSPELAYLKDYGWEVLPYQVDAGKVEANFMIASNQLQDGETKMYIVAFRGSASKKDWQSNLKVDMIPFGGTNLKESREIVDSKAKETHIPKVHKGFSEYTDVVLNTLVDSDNDGIMELDLFNELKNNPNSYLMLTGHSLGGAVATMLAERLVAYGMPKDRMFTVTFGAPAIGNKEFADAYGDKINLLRVTNMADPIPGSLQTFFGKYTQFGNHLRYKLSPALSEMQHDMAMYLDYSLGEYYKVYNKAVATEVKKPWPTKEIADASKPLVAVWVESSDEIDKRDYVPDLKRFIASEYRMMLPNYVIVDNNEVMKKMVKNNMNSFYEQNRALGADYALLIGIDGKSIRDADKWYMTLEQGLWDVKQGRLLTLDSFASFVSPVSGNVQATIASVRKGRSELKKAYPWIITDYSNIRNKIYF